MGWIFFSSSGISLDLKVSILRFICETILSLISKLTFDLSNLIGYKASNTKFYNLTINNDFKGIYILMEKIKRD